MVLLIDVLVGAGVFIALFLGAVLLHVVYGKYMYPYSPPEKWPSSLIVGGVYVLIMLQALVWFTMNHPFGVLGMVIGGVVLKLLPLRRDT